MRRSYLVLTLTVSRSEGNRNLLSFSMEEEYHHPGFEIPRRYQILEALRDSSRNGDARTKQRVKSS